MRWVHHNELSDDDMELIACSSLAVSMMRRKLVIKFNKEDTVARPKQMGIRNCAGLYYIRDISISGFTIFEILFELTEDRDIVEQHLVQYKMSLGLD